ncbi:hypothetical protein GFD25_03985 [Bifidobacterium aerophilum]|uniref:DUF2188 domain-containing protein n=2 Tax=Bifidobacterium aerophilum TaxID=1798155 RepID=A0A6N9Z4U2_9BIFI|nr:hypothetical protein [Bifidobacterium aerophilum]
MAGYLMYSWSNGIGELRDPYGHRVEVRSGNQGSALSKCRELFRRRYPRFDSDEIRVVRKH